MKYKYKQILKSFEFVVEDSALESWSTVYLS